jgi:hypothetical protein
MLKNLVYASGIAFILLLTILIPIGQTAATKSSAYDSGYNHGCSDARNGDQYINTPGKGASFHTAEFMRGYDSGHNACAGSSSGGNSDGGGGGGSRNNGRGFCDDLNRGNLAGAEAAAHALGYGSLDVAARVLCGIANILNR